MDYTDLPLENYIQRLDRCQAYRFTHPNQVPKLAELFSAESYGLAHDKGGFTLTLQGRLTGSSDVSEIVVNRGDYIVWKHFGRFDYEIVPSGVFRGAYEPQPSA